MEEIVNRPLIEQALESEVCKGLEVAAYPAALFVGGCFLGTLMTRCTYHYYYQRNLDCRLNYGIYIIGDPGTGKSFAGRLYNLIAGPIIQVSKEGMNAVNRYKRKYSEWEHGGQKGDGPKKPKALIRTHPARTSNKVLIEDMNNASKTRSDFRPNRGTVSSSWSSKPSIMRKMENAMSVVIFNPISMSIGTTSIRVRPWLWNTR